MLLNALDTQILYNLFLKNKKAGVCFKKKKLVKYGLRTPKDKLHAKV